MAEESPPIPPPPPGAPPPGGEAPAGSASQPPGAPLRGAPAPEPPAPRWPQVEAGLKQAAEALNDGFFLLSQRPGLLVLLFLPVLVLIPLSVGLRAGLGIASGSVLYTSTFLLATLLAYVPVIAAAILEAEALHAGRVLPHPEALGQALRQLRFLLVPVLVLWFGVEAIVYLLTMVIPVFVFSAQDPADVLPLLPTLATALTVVQGVILLFLAVRLLMFLPDRVLSEEDPPKLWPALLVLGLAAARATVAGAALQITPEAIAAGTLDVPAASLVAVLLISAFFLAILLLSLAGRIPAGLHWSWRASRDLDLLAASLTVVLVLALVSLRTWIFFPTLLGGPDALWTGIGLYFLAVIVIAGSAGRQWGFGLLLAGLLLVLFFISNFIPSIDPSGRPIYNPFTSMGVWLLPLALLAATATSLYIRMTEAE